MKLFQLKAFDQAPREDFVRPTGFRLFWFLLGEYFWQMVKLNLTFVLFCLPVVTIPAAYTAMSCVILRIIEDKHISVWQDFVRYFKENFKKASVYGWVNFAVFGLFFFMLYVCRYDGGTAIGSFLRVSNVAALVTMLLLIFLSYYVTPMICLVELPLGTIINNAFRLFCIKIWKCFLITLGAAALPLLAFVLLPYGAVIMIVFGVALDCYIISFFCYADIRKYIIEPYGREAAEESS